MEIMGGMKQQELIEAYRLTYQTKLTFMKSGLTIQELILLWVVIIQAAAFLKNGLEIL